MSEEITIADLENYLDESLPVEELARVEQALRSDPELTRRLREIHNRRDAGVHSLGEIWRRHRLSCPSRDQLGSYLLGVLDEELEEYVRFHLRTIGCRVCQANLDDLEQRVAAAGETAENRGHRLYDIRTPPVHLPYDISPPAGNFRLMKD